MEHAILTLAELRQLRREHPRRLFAHLRDVWREFFFGVEDHREDVDEWGGEFRVLLNRNIELHFVPRFNKSMETEDELPQFAVVPDDALAGTEVDREIPLDADGDSVKCVTFYVEPDRYARLVDELAEVIDRYDDWDVIPDTYFFDTELVSLIGSRVLEYSTVRAERAFDFRRGLVGGSPPSDGGEIDHEFPAE